CSGCVGFFTGPNGRNPCFSTSAPPSQVIGRRHAFYRPKAPRPSKKAAARPSFQHLAPGSGLLKTKKPPGPGVDQGAIASSGAINAAPLANPKPSDHFS